eukprot:Rmarinus@m.11558
MEPAIAAMVGAALTGLCVTPFDVVKTRVQAHVCVVPNCVTTCHHIAGPLDALRKIVACEGSSALWRGLPVTMVWNVPASGLYFGIYENLRSCIYMRTKGTAMEDYAPMSAGVIARSVAVYVAAPMDLIRTVVQADPAARVGPFLRKVVAERGVRSLWAGIYPTLLRDVPFSGIYWFLYEKLKSRVGGDADFLRHFLCGASSGMISAALTTPADVVKTRLQISVESRERVTGTSVCRQIFREEGWVGFTRGMAPRVMRIAPACAIMMASYEMGKQFLA